MTNAEFQERTEVVLAEEATEPELYWYLSFADEGGFRGAIVTLAHGLVGAAAKCHRLGINPGGEVMGIPVPSDARVDPEAIDRLLSREEISRFFGPAKSLGEFEAEEAEAIH